MVITPIKTDLVSSGSIGIVPFIDQSVTTMHEKDILVVTSKVISLCQGNTVPMEGLDKEQLIKQEADLVLPRSASRYNIAYTITQNTLISSAGIDESNSNGQYILWPKDSQRTANQLRVHLMQRFGLSQIGVIITDSTRQPMRRGIIGIALAHSGFRALRNYIGQVDLFGRPYNSNEASVSGGLAAAAVMAMGEGSEQTPLCLVSDAPGVEYQDHDPTSEELADLTVTIQDDMLEPFLTAVPWQSTQDQSGVA